MASGSNLYTPGHLQPGALKLAEGEITINEGRQEIVISVKKHRWSSNPSWITLPFIWNKLSTLVLWWTRQWRCWT